MQKEPRHIRFNSFFSANKQLKHFLLLVIFVLPFQKIIETFATNSNVDWFCFVRYLDEAASVISLYVLISFVLIKPTVYKIARLPLTKWIIIFLAIAFISLLWNRVAVFQGLFGVYDALKTLLVLYIFANLRYKKTDIIKLLNGLWKVGLVIAVVAIGAVIAAGVWNWGIEIFVTKQERFGLHRVISLTGTGSHNYLGLYMTLIFFLPWPLMELTAKKNFFSLILPVAIFLTFSRQAWLSFGLILCLLNKKLIPLGIVLVVVITPILFTEIQTYDMSKYYRGFTFIESVKILKEHPIFGVGPGMFGSLAASLWNSPYYVNWPEGLRNFSGNFRTLDSFWPWIWSEYGLVGLSAYLAIWTSIFFYLKKIIGFYGSINERIMCKIGRVLRYFILVLGVMGCVSGLNCAFVSFTYFAMVGMYISAYHLDRTSVKHEDIISK